MPVIKTLREPAAKERARQRRAAVLQRVLYLVLRSTITAATEGVTVQEPHSKRTVVAFPRILAYICDQPEERAILCLKGGTCARPCSLCDVSVGNAGSSQALTAEERDVVTTLERQYETAAHRRQSRQRRRRLDLEAEDSLNGYVPALACMPGLSTPPHSLFRMISFDVLHVRSASLLAFAHCFRLYPFVLIAGLQSPDAQLQSCLVCFAALSWLPVCRFWTSESLGSWYTG